MKARNYRNVPINPLTVTSKLTNRANENVYGGNHQKFRNSGGK